MTPRAPLWARYWAWNQRAFARLTRSLPAVAFGSILVGSLVMAVAALFGAAPPQVASLMQLGCGCALVVWLVSTMLHRQRRDLEEITRAVDAYAAFVRRVPGSPPLVELLPRAEAASHLIAGYGATRDIVAPQIHLKKKTAVQKATRADLPDTSQMEPFTAVCRCPSCDELGLHWLATPDRIPARTELPPTAPLVWRECARTGCGFVWAQLG